LNCGEGRRALLKLIPVSFEDKGVNIEGVLSRFLQERFSTTKTAITNK
jgi:hypothetical protein